MTSGLGMTLTFVAWWVGTGAVFVAARGGPRRRLWAFAAATAMLGVALAGLYLLEGVSGVSGTLLALLAGFTAWAWVELSFYTGFITGPSRAEPPAEAPLDVRFRYALRACLWHELMIPVLGVVVLAVSLAAGNPWAFRIYLTFWVLHEVARVNVLIGVPHPFAELLPQHLSHLQPYLVPRRAGLPIVLTLVAHVAAVGFLAAAALLGAGEGTTLGWTALAALVALGWLEHLVLMLPIPLERLWRSVGMGQGDRGSGAAPVPTPEAVPLR